MNLVGKIFVGIIALMSVVCLTVSVVSYASHHNWKERNVELTKQLDEAREEQQVLNAQKTELTKRIEEEKIGYVNVIAALETKTTDLQHENESLKKENDNLSEELAKRVEVISTNNTYINDLRQELATESYNLEKAQQLRANYLQDLAKTMEKLHELSAVYGDVKSQNDDLLKSYDEALVVLNRNGLSADPDQYGGFPQFPVQGTIETIKADSDGLLMISIGSDDGLSEHNKLDVKRGNSYLGKIEVVTLESNRAVCKVLPEYRQGVMMEGDDVYAQRNK